MRFSHCTSSTDSWEVIPCALSLYFLIENYNDQDGILITGCNWGEAIAC